GMTWTAVGQTATALNGLNITAIAFSTPRVLPSSGFGTNLLTGATAVTGAAQLATGGQLPAGDYAYKVSVVNKDNGQESDLSNEVDFPLSPGQDALLQNLPKAPADMLSGVSIPAASQGGGYTAAPTITSFGGTGTGATGTAILNGSVVMDAGKGVTITN